MKDKNLYIVAGCNGAGKTTASYTILPEIIECKEFVNADEIAKGLSPFQPETVSFEAGRIMINRINDLLEENESFAFETTLSTRSYKNKVLKAKERVKTRVKEGGHNIPEDVIERRYLKGIYNLFDIYLPIVDSALIFDNSYGKHKLIAHKIGDDKITKIDIDKFNQLKEFYDEKR